MSKRFTYITILLIILVTGYSSKIEDMITYSNSLPLSIIKGVAKNYFVQCQNIDFHLPTDVAYPEQWLNQFIKLIHQSYTKSFYVSTNIISSEYAPSKHCRLTAAVDTSKTVEYVTSRTTSLGYTWNYDTKVMIVCYAISLSNFIPKNFKVYNKTTDLVNVLYIDLNSGSGLHICSSSNRYKKFNFFTHKAYYKNLRRPCRVDLCGKTLPVALHYSPPMTEYIINNWNTSDITTSPAIMNIDSVKGYEVEFLKSLGKHFNFKIMFVNHSVGQINISQQFDKGTIEIFANLVAIDDYYNNDYLENTYPLLHHETYCLVLHRSSIPQKIVNLFEIFDYPIYILVVALGIFVSVTWLLILKLLTNLSVGNLPVGSLVMNVISVIVRENISRKMPFYQERILTGSFLLYSLVIISIFDGNLINVYNKLDTSPPFKNLEEFFTYNIPVLPSSSQIEIFFKLLPCRLHDRAFCKFGQKLLSLKNFTNIRGEELVLHNYKKYLHQGYAIFSFIGEARPKFVEHLKDYGVITDFVIVTDIFKEMRKKMGILVSKNLKFLSQINHYITRLREGRVTSLWYESSTAQFRNIVKKSTDSKGLHDFTLAEMQLPFICYGIGILSGCIALLLELFCNNRRQCCTTKLKIYNLIECKQKKQNKKTQNKEISVCW